ncbi:MAG: hypothetical protein Kow0027_00010 [Saprospiraceae bacterium]
MNSLKVFAIFAFAVFFFACGNDNPPDGNYAQVPENEQSSASADPMADIRAKAIPEDDIYRRVSQSLVPLQEEYRKASGKIPGIGKVTVFVDEHLTVLIKNEVKGDVFETKFNLKNLQSEGSGMRLVPDLSPGEFPGLRIFTIDNKPLVETYKNGELISTDDYFEIFLPARENIERITPVMVQTIKIAHGEI